ncbi:hypothetical protein QQM79_20340 [Marinobacteraceae bacterium S3BR75-40.1]
MKVINKILLIIFILFVLLVVYGNFNPRTVDVTESVRIDAPQLMIWNAVTDFEGVFHDSNRAHLSTSVTSRPEGGFDDGLTFLQKETVGGIYGVLDGRVFDVFPKNRYRWSANTTYSVWGFDVIEVFEGGDVRIEETRTGDGWRLSHRVFGHFPDTVAGRAMSWFMSAFMNIEADAATHTLVELEYVKRVVEEQ